MVFESGVKNIQAAAYNGARTVNKKRIVDKIGGFIIQNWLLISHEHHNRTNMFTVK